MNRILRFFQRRWCHRQLLGVVATAIASFATVATSRGQYDSEVKLPTSTFSLSQGNPEYLSRFRIETTFDGARLELRVRTTAAVGPQLAFSSIDGGTATTVDIRSSSVNQSSMDGAGMDIRLQLQCPNEAPCIADFEVATTALALDGIETTATLDVTAYPFGQPLTEDAYFAIEPL